MARTHKDSKGLRGRPHWTQRQPTYRERELEALAMVVEVPEEPIIGTFPGPTQNIGGYEHQTLVDYNLTTGRYVRGPYYARPNH